MKKIFLIALFVAACGGGKKAETTPAADPNTSTSNTDPAQPAPAAGEGTPCAQEIALVCPDGQIDACLKTPQEGDVHKCVAN